MRPCAISWRVLAENHRVLLLPEISARYEAERAEIENTVDVEVISAVALDAAQQEKLDRALSRTPQAPRAGCTTRSMRA